MTIAEYIEQENFEGAATVFLGLAPGHTRALLIAMLKQAYARGRVAVALERALGIA